MTRQPAQLSELWDGWRRRLAGDRRFVEGEAPVLSDRWDGWRRRLDAADADRRRAARDRRAGNRLFAVCVLVAAGAVTLAQWGPPEGGPLAPSPEDGITGNGIHLAPGEPFHDQTGVLGNGSDRVAELISVRPLGAVGSADVELHVAAGAVPGRPLVAAGGGELSRAYARRALRPVEGFRIPARSAALITATGRLADGESYGVRGYEVSYRVDRSVFRTELPQVFAACAGPRKRCDVDPLMGELMDAARVVRYG